MIFVITSVGDYSLAKTRFQIVFESVKNIEEAIHVSYFTSYQLITDLTTSFLIAIKDSLMLK